MAGEAVSASSIQNPSSNPPPVNKKKRSLPGTPDPEAEVIALSPKTLMATNRFVCEICGKGFQRDQNLQLHRRGHNLPWKLRQRTSKEPRKRVYVCPEKTCVHHHPSRALGDLTGIKKHFCRKHGEKKWKCDKCSRCYAVQSDWKAHSKTCGTREYRCDCGTIFSRRDSFITHRAFCDALAEETARVAASHMSSSVTSIHNGNLNFADGLMRSNVVQNFPSFLKPPVVEGEMVDEARSGLSLLMGQAPPLETLTKADDPFASQLSWIYQNKLVPWGSDELISSITLPMSGMKETEDPYSLLLSAPYHYSTQHHHHLVPPAPDTSVTALLQRAAQIGVTASRPTSEAKSPDSNIRNLNTNRSYSATHPGNAMENAADPLRMMYSTRHHAAQKDEGPEGETRDFLGVDAPTIRASSLSGLIRIRN
ncbi:zinc finger protein MAGPIE [Musa acuminata AAA Group]|uniref:zinc finger protein MAGPIE n=1 Tax=Musa acuminata AAA Group TaxID=214697 RepID=UPI0031D06AA6